MYLWFPCAIPLVFKVIVCCLKQYLEENNDDVRVEDFRMEYQRWLSEDPGKIRDCDQQYVPNIHRVALWGVAGRCVAGKERLELFFFTPFCSAWHGRELEALPPCTPFAPQVIPQLPLFDEAPSVNCSTAFGKQPVQILQKLEAVFHLFLSTPQLSCRANLHTSGSLGLGPLRAVTPHSEYHLARNGQVDQENRTTMVVTPPESRWHQYSLVCDTNQCANTVPGAPLEVPSRH